eukprot:11902939-Karenia_brevis.AAC.1
MLKRLWSNSKKLWSGRTNTRIVRRVSLRWEESLFRNQGGVDYDVCEAGCGGAGTYGCPSSSQAELRTYGS